jgi:hypothetical protein
VTADKTYLVAILNTSVAQAAERMMKRVVNTIKWSTDVNFS